LPPTIAPDLLLALSDEDAQAEFDRRALERFEARVRGSAGLSGLGRVELPLLGDDPHDLLDLVPLSLKLV
jgi:hypothetical protein